MLSGQQSFRRRITTEILAAVLKSEPAWKAISYDTPPNVLSLLRHCLAKDPAHRLHDIADARLELLEERAAEPAALRRRPALLCAGLVAGAALAFAAGAWWRGMRATPDIHWSGEQLGGSDVGWFANFTRRPVAGISVDGQRLDASCCVEAGLGQLDRLDARREKWLRWRTSAGRVDGAELYYNRFGKGPGGVYSVPLLGGEERLVVENAAHTLRGPGRQHHLRPGECRRRYQLHRYWPDTGRLQLLKGLLSGGGKQNFRMTPAGDRLVFLGEPADRPSDQEHLYALDLRTEKITRLAPDESITANFPFALAVTADGRSALYVSKAADLQCVVSVPMDGSSGIKTLFSITNIVGFLDAGSDGSVYSDVWERPGQIVRLAPSGGAVEQIASGPTDVSAAEAISLQDGRVAFTTRTAGRERLLVARSGRDPAPLVETDEETATPATPAGPGEVAL